MVAVDRIAAVSKIRRMPAKRPARKAPAPPASRPSPDWRSDTLAAVRALILRAVPDAVEERKWRDVPVWSKNGIVCTGETYAKVVKLTFAHGASLPDPHRLFNASLQGGTRRAIDLREGDRLRVRPFLALVKAAAARNDATRNAKGRATGTASSVRLLSGGNPQIAKADGDAPVQAYIAALPGWKRARAAALDALIVRTLPDVVKAVKWNSPLYGMPGRGYFLGLHAFTRYLKLAFFRGAELTPMPPVSSKDPHARYLHIMEDEPLDESQFVHWLTQAAKAPGWVP